MAENEPINITRVKTTYTLNEAVEYLKMRDKQLTNLMKTVRWVNVKTGKEIVIGYTS